MTIITILPILLGLISFLANTKQKMVAINFAICVSWCVEFYFNQAWSGLFVVSIAAVSSLYSAITNKIISKEKAVTIISLMALSIILFNLYMQEFKIITLIPLLAFAIYRYAELGHEEANYRKLAIIGGMIYVFYCFQTNSYGSMISELLLVAANFVYLMNIQKEKLLT